MDIHMEKCFTIIKEKVIIFAHSSYVNLCIIFVNRILEFKSNII